ncbi:hypothetical protein M0804_010808 [Polistes exclamans]|nr:hypothetical protein M0804_010808 [Polistes exclamans]
MQSHGYKESIKGGWGGVFPVVPKSRRHFGNEVYVKVMGLGPCIEMDNGLYVDFIPCNCFNRSINLVLIELTAYNAVVESVHCHRHPKGRKPIVHSSMKTRIVIGSFNDDDDDDVIVIVGDW